jgi:serine/threonine protein kinase
VGSRIGRDLTVIGKIDSREGEHLVLVWSHRGWCPMVCKVCRSPADARREAAVLDRLRHPNIVRFLGVAGPLGLLLEALDGPPLHRLLDDRPRRRLSVSDAIRVAIHVGAALEHVHARGFLHLDINPSNIVVARRRPVLVDFGSARRGPQLRLDYFLGTDAYMAPEHCRTATVTRATDVFGLGVTLYEMLTGALPFPERRGRRPHPQTTHEPLPFRRVVRDIPERLQALVLACLAREPAERPRLRELLPALHEFIVSGPPMWPPLIAAGHASTSRRKTSPP